MLKNTVLNVLIYEPFPNKCHLLNTVLADANTRDLSDCFELIVQCVFSNRASENYLYKNVSDINNNTSQKVQQLRPNWPLKLINRSQHRLDYDCMFNFLKSNSIFWISIFKLESHNVTFSLPTSNLPANIRYRIENGLNFLSLKLDTFNNLNLSALEFYLVNFLLLLYDTNTTSIRCYNDLYGNIELESVYADLLSDYLEFFLPINERDINFPNFSDFSASKAQMTSLGPIPTHHRHHTSLLKRGVQKTLTEDDLDMLSESDRIGDMKKVDLFLRSLIEFLLVSFTDQTDKSPVKQFDPIVIGLSKISQSQQPTNFASVYSKNLSLSNSPVKTNDPRKFLANVEVIFALSMLLRHFHLFSISGQLADWLDRKQTRFMSNTPHESPPIDELRMILFKVYLRKPFYKFFLFHLEHWPHTPSIKWPVELWFTYIQPSKFIPHSQQAKFANYSAEFVKENLLVYTDVYQLVLRRYSILDLTSEENLHTIQHLLYIFYNQSQLIHKFDSLFENMQSYLVQFSKQDCELFMRKNAEYKFVLSLFNDFDKPISAYRPLTASDNLKLISNFYDALHNSKQLVNSYIAMKAEPKRNFLSSTLKSFFSNDEHEKFLNHLVVDDLKRALALIDDCINLLQEFYKENGEIFLDKRHELSRPKFDLSAGDETIPDFEPAKNGLTLKLSPRGRFQIINRLRKPVITSQFDPDTAPVGEYENTFLVYIFQQISNLINQRFSSDFERIYNGHDLLARFSRRFLFGPDELKNKMCVVPSHSVNEPHFTDLSYATDLAKLRKVRLSFRKLANYRFLFYFFLFFVLFKAFSGFSMITTFISVSILMLLANFFLLN